MLVLIDGCGGKVFGADAAAEVVVAVDYCATFMMVKVMKMVVMVKVITETKAQIVMLI